MVMLAFGEPGRTVDGFTGVTDPGYSDGALRANVKPSFQAKMSGVEIGFVGRRERGGTKNCPANSRSVQVCEIAQRF